MYKSVWIQEKIVQQQSKKRAKAKPGAARIDTADDQLRKKGRKGAAGGGGGDAPELEEVIDELKNDLA